MSLSTEASERNEVEDAILEVRNATVRFDMERGTSRVLDDVSIDIEREEILGIVGESGSGKSMFASALLDAVIDPGVLTGDITYRPGDGDSIDLLNLSDSELDSLRWEEISMVFQGALSSFNPTMSVRGHFVETLEAHGKNVEEGMEYAAQLLNDLYLDPDRVLDSYPHELSGGMKQRALLGLSLLLEPEVVVMDEPTAALDLLMQRSILGLLEELKEKYDLTVVFITHDLPLVAGLADRLAVLYAFEFVEVAPASELLDDPSHPYTRALLKAAPNLEAPLEEMRPIEGDSPDPVNVPDGCSYHPRCPLADDTCRASDPSYFSVSENHDVACFHWEDADSAVPMDNSIRQGGWDREEEGERRTSVGESVVSLDEITVEFETDNSILTRIFSEPETVRAVDSVSMEIPENDVIALVGESGCGKTTLGKTAIAAQRPTGGTLEYRGQDVWEAKESRNSNIPFTEIRRSLQIIHQDPGSSLNPNRTVMATLKEPLRKWYANLSDVDREARIHGMLEEVGMTPADDYSRRYPHQLSGGEKQRVALVRALMMNPDLILADEAVSALDVSLRVEIMDLMLELQDQFNTSFLSISHDLSNARYLAEHADGRIGVMYLGEIVEIGPAEEVLADPQHPYTQVLKWATPNLESSPSGADEPPVRNIDIPDPVDPPSGCRFHTRCPEAREVCKQSPPEQYGDEIHQVACFRVAPDDHEYWESPSIVD